MQDRTVVTLHIIGLVLLSLSVLTQLVAAGISLAAGILPGASFLIGLSTPFAMSFVLLSAAKGKVRGVALGLIWVCVVLGLIYLALAWWLGRG